MGSPGSTPESPARPKFLEESLRPKQYLADALELVKLLRSRFGVEKVYLLGHSMGTVLGTLTVQRHPALFR